MCACVIPCLPVCLHVCISTELIIRNTYAMLRSVVAFKDHAISQLSSA